MQVLGIDPGTVRMGYGVLEDEDQVVAVDWGVISLPPSMPLEERLYQLYTHMLNMIAIFKPDAVAVEAPFMGKGAKQYVAPAFAVGQAQAVVLIAAAGQAIPVFSLLAGPGKERNSGLRSRHQTAGTGDGEDGPEVRLDTITFRRCRCAGYSPLSCASAPVTRCPGAGDKTTMKTANRISERSDVSPGPESLVALPSRSDSL